MAYPDIEEGDNFFDCGGFLVSKTFVLTAAHCNGHKITVRLGAHDISNPDGREEMTYAACHFPHPLYNNTTDNTDIMLLKLNRRLTLTNRVRTINLPTGSHSVSLQTVCSMAGWGDTSLNQSHRTDTLQEVNLTVISDQICDSLYDDYNASSMLCAGDPDDNKTVYKGDSGGPLVCDGVAEGIVSYCENNSLAPPVVYSRISHFLPWINDIMTHF